MTSGRIQLQAWAHLPSAAREDPVPQVTGGACCCRISDVGCAPDQDGQKHCASVTAELGSSLPGRPVCASPDGGFPI